MIPMPRNVAKAQSLLALGLIGMAAYPVVMRTVHPAFLAGDFAHGLWLGGFFGLEVWGLILLLRSRRRPAA